MSLIEQVKLNNQTNDSQQKVVSDILDSLDINRICDFSSKVQGKAFAPTNIALVKYWGKINTEINIPYTDSLSVSLPGLGAQTKISVLNKDYNITEINSSITESTSNDEVYLNNKKLDSNSKFYLRLKQYLDLFRNYKKDNKQPFNYSYKIETSLNIPVAAGVASSACGFAALILAFNDLFNLKLDKTKLSVLARLGSGSASRSLWNGFVYWQRSANEMGNNNIDDIKYADSISTLESHAYQLDYQWPGLYIGLLILSDHEKPISSRDAMLTTVETSILYQHGWQQQVTQDLELVKKALVLKDINLLGETAENNALAMHATMQSAKPAIMYSTNDTQEMVNKVWDLRKHGHNVYFTQDAGPNLKLIFDSNSIDIVRKNFKNIQIINLFEHL